MKKRFFSISVIAVYLFLGKERCNNEIRPDHIVWKEGDKLKWEDFHSTDFVGLGVAAASTIKIQLDYEVKESLVWFRVCCFFSKKESVVRYEKTPYALGHEQGHFDIGEIFARKQRKAILGIRNKINRNNYKMLDSISHALNTLHQLEQEKYDKGTDFANDSLQQQKWEIRIKKSLDSLVLYKAYKY